jgi:hypothetical protein
MTPTQQKIYNNLLVYLEEHCTLDNNIPADTGCAEAVSFILQKSGIAGLPITGIAGTATLYEWLSHNPHFKRVYVPEAGALIISPTGYGNNTVSGHTGFLGKYGKMYPGDWGIVSNDSNTGLLLELWNLNRWQKHYGQQGGLPVAFFRAL